MRTLTIDNPTWIFPSDSISIRNLTHLNFSGHFPLNSQVLTDIILNGRQIESLSLDCALDCNASAQIRGLTWSPTMAMLAGSHSHAHAHSHGHGHHQHNHYQHPHLVHQLPPHHPFAAGPILPFLRHFSFTVHTMGRRTPSDRDLFPALSEFLRDRTHLRTLALVSYDEQLQRAVGFDASVWGVLPSLTGLRGLTVSWPKDLTPGLAAWLVPRSVKALTLDCTALIGREVGGFLNVSGGFFPIFIYFYCV